METIHIIFTIVLGLVAIQIVSGIADNYSTQVSTSVSDENITVAGTATGTTNALAFTPVVSGSEIITTYCPA